MLGVTAMAVTKRVLGRDHDVHVGSFSGVAARAMVLIVVVMTVHSFAEGIGVGVSFGGGETFGLVIAFAIAVHNIPEGLAISLVLVPRGVTVGRAAAWSVFSSLPQPLMAVPAFLFVEAFEQLLPVGLAFAAGAMLWMVASELLPEALRGASFGLRSSASPCLRPARWSRSRRCWPSRPAAFPRGLLRAPPASRTPALGQHASDGRAHSAAGRWETPDEEGVP